MTTNPIYQALSEQYGAAFKTLEQIINYCPDDIWINSPTPPIFSVVHHILFFVDFYFSKDKEERKNYQSKFPDQKDNFADKPLSKNELLEYITELKVCGKNWFTSLTFDDLQEESVFEWHGSSLFSSLLYNLRHIMLHIGAIQVRLRQHGVEQKYWVSNAKL